VAGASSGAIAGALIAAGSTPEELRQVLTDLDWRALTTSEITRRLAGAPVVGPLVRRLRDGRTLDPQTWIAGLLEDKGVVTWADLKFDDAGDWIHPRERYRLVVRCLDVVNHRVVRLPWDYHRYGLDADTQSVAEAVRASMSVPLIFEPVTLGDRDNGGGLLIDGALGTGFSVDTLDRHDGGDSTHPTFALQLLSQPRRHDWPGSDFALVRSMVQTMIDTGNEMAPVGQCDERRTIALDTSHVRTLDVRITPQEEDALFEVGRSTMATFLDAWDHQKWARDCRGA
ncbi:MAG: NTE family protein, partial [Glaciecola sp.]